VRRVLWRPEYECELAIVSNEDFGSSSSSSGGEITANAAAAAAGAGASPDFTDMGSIIGRGGDSGLGSLGSLGGKGKGFSGDAVEIWDVRRGWIAKWAVGGSAIEGGVAGEPGDLGPCHFM
jgi:WD repeat-containing protein 24